MKKSSVIDYPKYTFYAVLVLIALVAIVFLVIGKPTSVALIDSQSLGGSVTAITTKISAEEQIGWLRCKLSRNYEWVPGGSYVDKWGNVIPLRGHCESLLVNSIPTGSVQVQTKSVY